MHQFTGGDTSDLTCFACDRSIRIDQAFEQVPGITVASGTVIRHVLCPPGTCARCGAERLYAELSLVPDMDDPNLLLCQGAAR